MSTGNMTPLEGVEKLKQAFPRRVVLINGRVQWSVEQDKLVAEVSAYVEHTSPPWMHGTTVEDVVKSHLACNGPLIQAEVSAAEEIIAFTEGVKP